MDSQRLRGILKMLFGFMATFMFYLVIATSLKSDLFALPAAVVTEPWFHTTLVDFYFLVTILAVWVIYKERSLIRSISWIIAFICLGSIAAALYVFVQLMQLKQGDSFEKVLLPREQV